MSSATLGKIKDVMVPATISDLTTLDPGELRIVRVTLPEECEYGGVSYRVRDTMRPGNAFLALPFGVRTEKSQKRMYTRSNCSQTSEGSLETIINLSHEKTADTSVWWLSDQIPGMRSRGETIPIRSVPSEDGRELVLAENSGRCARTNLRLEPDDQWAHMRFLALAFSTGITPFLAYVRYMKSLEFGRTADQGGAHLTLIVSVRNPQQLMAHDELLTLEKEFPRHFRYVPVLTREWPSDWAYGRGRIVRAQALGNGEESIDIAPLREVVPDISDRHVRMCGNRLARRQLEQGLQQQNVPYQSFRSEVW